MSEAVTTAITGRVLRSRGLHIVLLVIVIGGALAWWVQRSGGPASLRDALGPAAPTVIVPVLALISATPFPSEVFAIPTSGLYGFWFGAGIVWIAWFLASGLQFTIARRTSRDLDLDAAVARLPRWVRRFPVSHPAFLICGRWIPGGPHVVNASAGVYGVSPACHLCCAAVGILPQALFISAVGNALFGL